MPIDKESTRTLPIAGARLVRFSFCGNGKDSEVTIEAEGARKVVLPLNDAEMNIDISGPITVKTRGGGDSSAAIEIVPAPQQSITIDEATIHCPDADDDLTDWDEAFRQYVQTGSLAWAITLHLRLVSRTRD